MTKKSIKVGVASLGVAAIIATTSMTGAVSAAKQPVNSNSYKEWKFEIGQLIMDQFQIICNAEQINIGNIKVIFKPIFEVIKPITKPQVTPQPTPEVTPQPTPEVTPQPTPEVTPQPTPEVTPQPAPEVTPQPTPEVTPQPTPEVTPQPTPEVTPQPTPEVTPQPTPEAPEENSEFTQVQLDVLNIVNEERAKQGLKASELDAEVSVVATEKARDMAVNNYFSHTSPTYGSPFDMLKLYGVAFSYAGENIAYGQTSAEQVMNDWMNSTGHRANILSGNFTKIGIGFYEGKWVQMFVG